MQEQQQNAVVHRPPIDWTTPCSLCGGHADRVIHGGARDCDPDKQVYLCRECEQKTKGHQS